MPEVLGFGKKCLKPFLYVYARVAELADALDLGSSGKPWGFKSLRAHHSKVMCGDLNSYMTFSFVANGANEKEFNYNRSIKL